MVHSSSGDFWTLLGTVLYPFLAIWRLISNFLFSNPPAQTSARAASLEPANLASSSNSEKRQLCFPRLQNVSNATPFCYGYFVFFLCKGKNPDILKLYFNISSRKLTYVSFLSHVFKISSMETTSPLLVLLSDLLNSLLSRNYKGRFFVSDLNSNSFLTRHILSDKVFPYINFSQSSGLLCSR